jgi:uncharacterized protein YegJ (DUF2314 family)
MTNDFNILEFAGLSNDQPWELEHSTPTDLRAVISGEQIASIEDVGKAIASFVGETIEAEEVEAPSGEILWAMRARVNGLPTDCMIWAERLNKATLEAAEIESGWVLALQTVLHHDDPLTHFSNLMRLLGGIDLPTHSVCDLPTGRWFPKDIIKSVFVEDEIEPPEEILWITRLVEAPEGGDPEESWAWVSTHGLTRCGRAELEMFGVPAVLSSEAVHLIDGLTALTLETSLPPEGQPISLGSDLLVSLMECKKAISFLQDGMPGREDRTIPSVVIASHDGACVYPKDALETLHLGETAVMKTLRSTNRQSLLAKSQWDLLIKTATHIGESEHAACLVQVPWANTEDEEAPREYLWFRVVKAQKNSVTGELAHKPALVTSLEEEHREEITPDDISDWVLMTPVGPMGPGDGEAIDEFLEQFKG